MQSIFTVNKNELTFELVKDDEKFYLVVNLSKIYPFVLIKKVADFKSSRYVVFEQLCGQPLLKINVTVYDKFITLDFGNFHLKATFYGPKPNILLFNQEDQHIDSFKSVKDEIFQEEPVSQFVEISPELIENLFSASPKSSISDVIKLVSPASNKRMISEICYRMKVDANIKLKSISDKALFTAVIMRFFMKG